MSTSLENVELRNLFVAAKKYSSRSVVLEFGNVALAFAERYAELDSVGKDNMRAEYPGIANKKYAYGWLGQWARLVDCDTEAAGDSTLSARTMIRHLKFSPIANELSRRDCIDAIPVKLGSLCMALQKALGKIDPAHGPAPTPETRSLIVHAVADAFVAVSKTLEKPLNASAAHAKALDEAIAKTCADKEIDLGPATERKPRKRARQQDEASDIASAPTDATMGLDWHIASVAPDGRIAQVVSKRLEAMIPEILRIVEREFAVDGQHPAHMTRAPPSAAAPNTARLDSAMLGEALGEASDGGGGDVGDSASDGGEDPSEGEGVGVST